jgi:hypothetical protein
MWILGIKSGQINVFEIITYTGSSLVLCPTQTTAPAPALQQEAHDVMISNTKSFPPLNDFEIIPALERLHGSAKKRILFLFSFLSKSDWLGCFHILISASTRKPRVGSGNNHYQIALTELLKLYKSGQFPDEPVRIEV